MTFFPTPAFDFLYVRSPCIFQIITRQPDPVRPGRHRRGESLNVVCVQTSSTQLLVAKVGDCVFPVSFRESGMLNEAPVTKMMASRGVWRYSRKSSFLLTSAFLSLLHGMSAVAFARSIFSESLSSGLGRTSTLSMLGSSVYSSDPGDRSFRLPHNVAGRRRRRRNKLSREISLARGQLDDILSSPESAVANVSSARLLPHNAPFEHLLRRRLLLRRGERMTRSGRKLRPAAGNRTWGRLAPAMFLVLVGLGNGINAANYIVRHSFPTVQQQVFESLLYMLAFFGLGGFLAYKARAKKLPRKPAKPHWKIKRLLFALAIACLSFANLGRNIFWLRGLANAGDLMARERNTAIIEFLLQTAISSYLVYSARPDVSVRRKR